MSLLHRAVTLALSHAEHAQTSQAIEIVAAAIRHVSANNDDLRVQLTIESQFDWRRPDRLRLARPTKGASGPPSVLPDISPTRGGDRLWGGRGVTNDHQDACDGARLIAQAQVARVRMYWERGLSTDEIARRAGLDEADVCRVIERGGWVR